MRKLIILLLALMYLGACEKDKDVNNELNITLKSTQKSPSDIINPEYNSRVEFYPNPFQDVLNFQYYGANICEVYIYNYEGLGKKFIIEDANIISFDFSNEKDGAYSIEVLIDGVVFREFVIKEK